MTVVREALLSGTGGLTAAEVTAIMDAGAMPDGAAVDAAGKATTTWALLKR